MVSVLKFLGEWSKQKKEEAEERARLDPYPRGWLRPLGLQESGPSVGLGADAEPTRRLLDVEALALLTAMRDLPMCAGLELDTVLHGVESRISAKASAGGALSKRMGTAAVNTILGWSPLPDTEGFLSHRDATAAVDALWLLPEWLSNHVTPGTHAHHNCLVTKVPTLVSLSPWDLQALERALGLKTRDAPSAPWTFDPVLADLTPEFKLRRVAVDVPEALEGVKWEHPRVDRDWLVPVVRFGLSEQERTAIVEAMEPPDQRIRRCPAEGDTPHSLQGILPFCGHMRPEYAWELTALLFSISQWVQIEAAKM
jgi:hypothetical protein